MARNYPKKSYRPSRKTSVPKSIKAYVKKQLPKVELKCKTESADEVAMDSLSPQYYIQELTSMVQGTTRATRIGNKCTVKKIDIRGAMFNNSTRDCFTRHLLLKCAGDVTVSTIGEFFDPGNGTIGDLLTVNGLNQIYTRINPVKFKVLMDKTIKIAGAASGDGGAATAFFKHATALGRGLNIQYENNTSGEYNQDWRLVYVVLLGEAKDDSIGGGFELSFQADTYFTDA